MKDKILTQILSNDDNNTFSLTWGMTSWCNYRCPYCIQTYHSKDKPSEADLILRARKINELLLARKKTNINLSLLGGEITFYDLTKIISEFSCGISQLVLITNFSQKIEYFKNLYTFCESKKIILNLMCSYHEVGAVFFNKYIDLIKWCVNCEHPLPILSFVYGNDFDLNLINTFSDLPYHLIHFNIKQCADGSIEKLDEAHYALWQQVTGLKNNPEYNRLILTLLKKVKAKEVWWSRIKLGNGYSLIYNDGSIEHISDMKDILTLSPELLYNPIKYCNALQSCMYIADDGTIYVCSTNVFPLGNIDTIKLKDYLFALTKFRLKSCPVSPCPLCHNVNIYDNVKGLLNELLNTTKVEKEDN